MQKKTRAGVKKLIATFDPELPIQERDLKVTIEMALYVSKIDAERRKSEQAIKESEEKFRTVVENAKELILSQDENGKILLMNNSAAKQLGGNPSDYEGKMLWELFSKEYADLRLKQIREVIKTGKEKTYEIQAPFKKGSQWYLATMAPLKTGTLGAVYSILTNITQQKKAEIERETLIKDLESKALIEFFYQQTC